MLLHFGKRRLECKRLARSNTDARDCKPAVSGKILCILCIHVNKNLPVLDYEAVSRHQSEGVASNK